MAPYYKDGYLEAVLFIFLDGNKILIEHRPEAGGKETFIPNGKIEDSDLRTGTDYPTSAMLREIAEELGSTIQLKDYELLGEFYAEAIKTKFFGFLVKDWVGIIPAFTLEEGRKFADLEWIEIEEYARHLKFDTSTFFVERVRAVLGPGPEHQNV